MSGFEESQELYNQIRSIVEILLDRIEESSFANWDVYLKRHAFTNGQLAVMDDRQKLEAAVAIVKARPKPAENLAAALDLIFEVKNGWPQGTVGKMPLRDVLRALEIAMTDPGKPSVWEVTE